MRANRIGQDGWGDLVLFEARACLEARMSDWIHNGTPIAVYPAGGHTRDLFLHPDFEKLHVVGVLDRNPSAQGQRIGSCEVMPPERIGELGAQVILISSPPHHEAILRENGEAWRAMGLEVIDLCEGAQPYAALFPLALKHGLVLDDSQSGVFRITRPGNPSKVIRMGRAVWEHCLEVLRNFDWFFNSVDPDERTSDTWVVDFSGPSYKTLAHSRLCLHFPSMPEPDSTNEMYLEQADLKPGDVVLDLGAYAGGSTILFAQKVGPSGRVLALEPDSLNFQSLRRNLEAHKIQNALLESSAIWDQDGECFFEAEGFMGSGLSEVSERCHSTTRVPVLTLRSLLLRHGLSRVDFIKMDIEGAELRVVQQALPLLCELRPRMVIEPHYLDYKKGVLNTPELQALLEAGGFRTRLVGQGDDAGHPMISVWWEAC